jgi:adenine specific DNA methylase Mod
MVKLIWEGKNSTSTTFEKTKHIFEFENLGTTFHYKNSTLQKERWSNKLFWSDNLDVLQYLLGDFKDQIDLIYIDPPFFSGSNYHIQIQDNGENYHDVAYFDRWNNDLDSYLQMMHERLGIIRELLSKKGLLFVHLDWHVNHYLRVILDETFGENRFVNSIIWHYYNKYSAGKRNLPRAYDNILVYSKSNNYKLNEIRIPRKKPRKQLKRKMVDGVLKNVKDENGRVVYRVVSDKKMDDVWRIPCLQPASKEWTGFPTQKHHDLLERIIRLGSDKGDLIADFFCGSGTTLLIAEKLERRWIGCDISKYSIYLTRERIKHFQSTNNDERKVKYPYELFTILTDERKNTINSGFFEKELRIKRKK